MLLDYLLRTGKDFIGMGNKFNRYIMWYEVFAYVLRHLKFISNRNMKLMTKAEKFGLLHTLKQYQSSNTGSLQWYGLQHVHYTLLDVF